MNDSIKNKSPRILLLHHQCCLYCSNHYWSKHLAHNNYKLKIINLKQLFESCLENNSKQKPQYLLKKERNFR